MKSIIGATKYNFDEDHSGKAKVYRGLQPEDVQAIQFLYGIGVGTQGDTVWKGIGKIDTFDDKYTASETVYDANGIDTLDLSALVTREAHINLGYGKTSIIAEPGKQAQGTIAIAKNVPSEGAYGGLIENAFGGANYDTILGNFAANSLRGNDGDDTISGGDGDDKISGGRGNDTVSGNAGKDTYYFSHALNGATNVDTIKGFSGIDLMQLSSSIFTKVGKGALPASAFWSNTTGKAHDATDRVIWETDTGKLYYDPDGTGAVAGTLFAVVTGNTGAINAGDFVIA